MSAERKKVLVVEDNPGMLSQLRKRLYGEGYEPYGASDSTAGIKSIRDHQPDLMILDVSLAMEGTFNSSLDGMGVLEWVRRTMPEITIPVILYTVDESETVDTFAQRQGVYGVHRKAGGFNQLLQAIAAALNGKSSEPESDDDGQAAA
jgi:CheY-like chemotaxis protein